MAQQTINVGTAPNDGTGTPLRTAFQYTNSNFSELYTAVGPSGNNIVVPGSATITGDLTVDTSTLKVDSANNRVGVGTASPSTTFHTNSDGVASGAGWTAIGRFNNVAQTKGIDLGYNPSNNNAVITALSGGATSGFEWWSFDGGWATRMTLNATGLGVGTSPSAPFTVKTSSAYLSQDIVGDSTNSWASLRFRNSANNATTVFFNYDNSAYKFGTVGSETVAIYTANTERLRIDSSGNVGIGVQPSAWRSTVRALQIGGVGALYGSTATTGAVSISRNAYDSATGGTYISNDEATLYEQDQLGRHVWYNAPAGTGAITWTQAMTLDASGRLLVGPTSANASGGVLQLSSGITFPATQVPSSDANTLDDYEEGTFTATLKGTVSDPTTPVTTTARYTKIGRVVTVTIQFSSVTTTGASGRIQIDGLPFTNNSSLAGTGSVGFNGMATFTGSPFASLSASSSTIAMFASNSAGAYTAVTFNAGTTQDLWTSLTYTV